jgi:hypothetical protein
VSTVNISRPLDSDSFSALDSAISKGIGDINVELSKPMTKLAMIFDKLLFLLGLGSDTSVQSVVIKNRMAQLGSPLRNAISVGQEAQRQGDYATTGDHANVQSLAKFFATKKILDGEEMTIAEITLRTANSEIQQQVIAFLANCPFNERRAICRGMNINELRHNYSLTSDYCSRLETLASAAVRSEYEEESNEYTKACEQRKVVAANSVLIASDVGEISSHHDISGIKLQLEKVRTRDGACAALQLLCIPEMLNQLKRLGVLSDNAVMVELISAASGPAPEIAQNFGDDRSNFVLNVDAAVSAIVTARTAITNGTNNDHKLVHMGRLEFVKNMAKAEEWYFGDQTGEFPEELAGIRQGVEMWFKEFAEGNFNDDEITRFGNNDYKRHFRAYNDTNPGGGRQLGVWKFASAGCEGAYLTLIEYQNREVRKDFTNLSLAIVERFRADGSDGLRVAQDYCSMERQQLEACVDLHTVKPFSLNAFWCQHPTEKFWNYLFTPRSGELPQETANRVVAFLTANPRPMDDDWHSTNFLEYLANAPCTDQGRLLNESATFKNDTYAKGAQCFWNGLQAVLNDPSISVNEREKLWRKMSAPLNDQQAWMDAGPHTGNGRGAIATIGREDFEQLSECMRAAGCPNFNFDMKETDVRTRESDLAFYSASTGETMLPNVTYLTTYKRLQPTFS